MLIHVHQPQNSFLPPKRAEQRNQNAVSQLGSHDCDTLASNLFGVGDLVELGEFLAIPFGGLRALELKPMRKSVSVNVIQLPGGHGERLT